MKKGKLLIIWIVTSLVLFSCRKTPESIDISQICGGELVSDYNLLEEGEKSKTCDYLKVYLYQEKVYFQCVCCLCDKDAIAYDCDKNYLCELSQNCMNDFIQEAIYQFSIVLK